MSLNLSYCQEKFSKHSLQFFKNNSEKKTKGSEVWIIIDKIKIKGKEIEGSYWFSKIDKNKTFKFIIKTNGVEFKTGTFKAWYLNNGSSITVGKLTRIKKLLSVAEYNGIEQNDKDFYVFSKRFFIANDVYTIDIINFEKVKRLDYLIVNPHQEGDGSYVLTQKIIKTKE